MTRLQPLAAIDRREEPQLRRGLARQHRPVNQEGVTLTPDRREALWSALGSLAGFPAEQRTLTLLTSLVQDLEIRKALRPFTLEGA